MQNKPIITLEQFIIDSEKRSGKQTTGDFSQLLRDIVLAAKIINREVNRAGLVDILGSTGASNVQGEEVKKLDVFANEQMISALSNSGQTCVMASEENEDIIVGNPQGKYVVLFDPLDGSSNIDVNASIGTIFSIYRRKSEIGTTGTIEDCLQPGRNQVCAGYVIYGSSTMLVFTTGDGVNGFTLDPSIGEFLLSHPNIQIPSKCNTYSINEGISADMTPGLMDYLSYLKQNDKATNRPYSARYIGSLVADFHRNLLKGGIYIYPATKKSPNGKLRLLYEGNPLSYLAEQAGGIGFTSYQNVLDIIPQELHQRIPLFIGNTTEVEKVLSFLKAEVPVV
ncbi:MAG: class 1 fructose-bisphosphatase [Bacteroidia bacterium]|nr:class 1 fructose-bisphosphatase [Bacteroidia bacterium]